MTLGDRAFVLLQHVLPKRLITAIVYRIARVETAWFRDPLIRQFARLYRVNLEEALEPQGGWRSFNDFFTRALKPGRRPIDGTANTIVSPCDGTVAERGDLDGDRLLQAELTAKRRTYTLGAFLGDEERAAVYIGGHFATIYLAPYNYHRVHVPLEGTLVALHYEPGLHYSVNRVTAEGVEALYARNERLVCHFEGPDGPYALVFVGALNVGSVSLTGLGEVLPRRPRRPGALPLPEQRYFARGAELGWFNMGSTVVLVFPRGTVAFAQGFERTAVVSMGQRIARRQA
jgi:phosphatidylserine decarboxylase